ncbi:transposase [Streptomyces sp. ET3-23]|uniref:transposase n=1 Tax=Streptomyces sp. ET3-23 TaxID=2885643 RepID=UPI002235276D|nr:transposase [Streptomyces sp. ET3-23]
MTPPKARTWSRRGITPVIRVRGRSHRRISIAALACYRPGHRSRLIYRARYGDGDRRRRKSFAWTDYRDLLTAVHQQLGGPIVLIWDNLNTHLTAGIRKFTAERDWLHVYQLPPYAPDLNPVEGIWSLLRRGPLANTAFTNPDHLARTLRTGLRAIQYRSDLIDGCLTGTGLTRNTT